MVDSSLSTAFAPNASYLVLSSRPRRRDPCHPSPPRFSGGPRRHRRPRPYPDPPATPLTSNLPDQPSPPRIPLRLHHRQWHPPPAQARLRSRPHCRLARPPRRHLRPGSLRRVLRSMVLPQNLSLVESCPRDSGDHSAVASTSATPASMITTATVRTKMAKMERVARMRRVCTTRRLRSGSPLGAIGCSTRRLRMTTRSRRHRHHLPTSHLLPHSRDSTGSPPPCTSVGVIRARSVDPSRSRRRSRQRAEALSATGTLLAPRCSSRISPLLWASDFRPTHTLCTFGSGRPRQRQCLPRLLRLGRPPTGGRCRWLPI